MTEAAPHLILDCPLQTREIAKRIIIPFGETVCDLKLYNYQIAFAIAIIEAVLDRTGERPTGLYARQSGKSEVLAVVANACAILLPLLALEYPDDDRFSGFKKGFFVGVYGPKQDKAQIIYDRIRKYAVAERAEEVYADPEIDIEIIASRGNSCAWSHGSRILAQTASITTNSEGETWHLLIIDESQDVSSAKIEKELLPMLTATNGTLVMIGTASYVKGFFFNTIKQNIEKEKRTGKRQHFAYDYERIIAEKRATYEREAVRHRRYIAASLEERARMLEEDPDSARAPNKFHLNYGDFVRGVLERLKNNVDDEFFRMNYRILWTDSSTQAINIEFLRRQGIPTLETSDPPVANIPFAAGLDIAKGTNDRNDKTVLTIGDIDIFHPRRDPDQRDAKNGEILYVYDKTIRHWGEFSGSFEDLGRSGQSQYKGIVDMINAFPSLAVLAVDCTSMGDPVYERLCVLLPHVHVIPFYFSAVKKSAGYKKYLLELKHGRIRYAAGPETSTTMEYEKFMEQHEDLQRHHLPSGLLACEAPPGQDYHDDYPDSAMLFNHACEIVIAEHMPTQMEVVEVSQWADRSRHRQPPPHASAGTQPAGAREQWYSRGRTGGRYH